MSGVRKKRNIKPIAKITRAPGNFLLKNRNRTSKPQKAPTAILSRPNMVLVLVTILIPLIISNKPSPSCNPLITLRGMCLFRNTIRFVTPSINTIALTTIPAANISLSVRPSLIAIMPIAFIG